MIIECQTCGCVYRINMDDEDKEECDVTAELVQCPMCFNGEEYLEVEAQEPDKIPSPYKPRAQVLSEQAEDIIKNNYVEKTDKELVVLIEQKIGEKYGYDQVKARRRYMGLDKPRGVLTAEARQRSIESKKKYTPEHFDWLKENIHTTENNIELANQFNEKFGLNISHGALNQQMSTNGISRRKMSNLPKEENPEPVELVDPHQKEIDEKAKRERKGMSADAVKVIEENYMSKTDDELRELIADETGQFYTGTRIGDYRLSNGMDRPQGWQPDGFEVAEENEEEEDAE